VSHKRVRRIMREDNLLCLRHRKFVVTTDSNHNRPVYPNLAGELVLTGINQLWVADITYIRLEAESFTWRWCWMPTRAASWVGNWTAPWKTTLAWQPCAWPCEAARRRPA
jgi:transposase InsO family protein